MHHDVNGLQKLIYADTGKRSVKSDGNENENEKKYELWHTKRE